MTDIDSVTGPSVSDQDKEELKEEIKVTFITPGIDPVNHPDATVGSYAQNEFTYSMGNPGILTINLRAKVTPSGKANEAKNRIRFNVELIIKSKMEWEGSSGGRPTKVNGDYLETSVTFTGLPEKNSDFGKKKAQLFLDDSLVEERTYEVFFPRDAKNHPGGQPNSPNWFYYWCRVARAAGIHNFMYYDKSSGSGTMAVVKGMRYWDWVKPPDKTTIYIYDEVVILSPTSAYGVGQVVSGIDSFMATVFHENKHVEQIANADRLVPNIRCWRYGYSWNKPQHNHWEPGPDGKWGNPPGLTTDKVAIVPPIEPGHGDDVDIDNPLWRMWPNVWPLPVPSWSPSKHPIEDEAIMYADSKVTEHKYAKQDWGDPGKNHQTKLRWDD